MITLLPRSIESSSIKRISGVSRSFIRFPNSLRIYLAFDFNPAMATSLPLSSPNTDMYTLTTYRDSKTEELTTFTINYYEIC